MCVCVCVCGSAGERVASMCLAVYLHSLHTAMYVYTSAGPACVRYLHSSALLQIIACVHI